MFFKSMYNTNKLPGVEWCFPIDQRAKSISATDVSRFYNYLGHEPMYNFIQKTNFLHLWTILFPILSFKTIPNWNFTVVGFRKYLFCHLLPKLLFKWFTAWNTRFNINRIFIVFFTCKFYIGFLPFLCFSTCSVRLLLSISRK